MQELRGQVGNPASPRSRNDGDKPAEGDQGAGKGGGESQLLVVATEEGQRLGFNTPVRAAAGGGGETSPFSHWPPHQEMYWLGGETSMNGGPS